MSGEPGKRRSLKRTLGAGAFFLVLAFTSGQAVLFSVIADYSLKQKTQSEEWYLAEELAASIGEFATPDFDFGGVRARIEEFLNGHLGKDVYLLDHNGQVLLRFARQPDVARNSSVSLLPLQDFFAPAGRAQAPLYGTDPNTGQTSALFSVARLTIRNSPAYLYIVLNNTYAANRGLRLLNKATILSMFSSSTAALAAALVVGVLLLRPLVRRLAELMHTVRLIGAGESGVRSAVTGSDEVAELGETINRMAEQIEASTRKLARKDALRRELVENVWHDIRGPVAALRGLTEIMQRDQTPPSPESRERYIGAIGANATRLARFLDELRDISDLEMEERTIRRDPVDLLDVVDELFAGLSERAAKQCINLQVTGEEQACLVIGDAQLLSRLLQNLMENAFRYTAEGGIVAVDFHQDANRLLVSVRDSGVGISAAELPTLFQRGVQGGESQRRGVDSRGLGLAIVAKIAEAHGSTVDVTSKPGEGTTFTVSLERYDSHRSAGTSSHNPEL